MSVATEITRLQGLKGTIRTKLLALGVIVSESASLDDCATALAAITDNGGVSETVDLVAPSYTVPEGYHDGTGAVALVSETKNATPTTSSQDITPSAGKVLEKVTVAAIPAGYAIVSNVTAAAGDVLTSKVFVTAAGAETAGTMANNGAISQTIDGTTTTSYTVPAGYHNGSGTVSLDGTIEAALAAI